MSCYRILCLHGPSSVPFYVNVHAETFAAALKMCRDSGFTLFQSSPW